MKQKYSSDTLQPLLQAHVAVIKAEQTIQYILVK